MNNIDGIHANTEGLAQFATGYFDYLSTVLSSVDDAAVDALGEFLLDARERNATIFIAGQLKDMQSIHRRGLQRVTAAPHRVLHIFRMLFQLLENVCILIAFASGRGLGETIAEVCL